MYFSYEFKKTVESVSVVVFVELKKMVGKVADKDTGVDHADTVFNTKSERRF
jgi:hypothetical protein